VQVYPNPMTEQARLIFVATETGNAIISIVDISGRTLYQISTIVSNGVNSFRISGIYRGMYFVKINCPDMDGRKPECWSPY
jgi:collagenase-like PrtC family protease